MAEPTEVPPNFKTLISPVLSSSFSVYVRAACTFASAPMSAAGRKDYNFNKKIPDSEILSVPIHSRFIFDIPAMP